jgi:hypothetical protein
VTLQSILLRLLPIPQPGRVLADAEWRTLTRVAEALLPNDALTDAPNRASVPPEDVADNVEAFLGRGRSKRAWRVRALLHLVEWSPLLHRSAPLSRMSVLERRRLIEAHYVDGIGLWGLCAKVRYLVMMGAYGDARMHPRTSYVPVSKRPRFEHAKRDASTAVTP